MSARRRKGISPGRALALVGAVIFIAATVEFYAGVDQIGVPDRRR